MTKITDVRTIAIDVSDQDRALAFFTDTLGFEKRLDAPMSPTSRWIEVAPPGATTSIALNATQDAQDVGTDTGIRFTAPDASAAHEPSRAEEHLEGPETRLEQRQPLARDERVAP